MATPKNNILVPYDFSDDSANALKVAYKIANRQTYDIILLHVIEIPRYRYVEPEFSESYALQLRDMAMHELATLPEIGKENHISTKLLVKVGYPSRVILNFIKREKIGLVIMGSRDIHNPGKLIEGSTTEKIVRYAKCPILTVTSKTGPNNLKDIVLASDLATAMPSVIAI
ncbi:MAG: universal stress protein [Reichenbachiella sp.]|uniref:universal stress protein n=1 Tax=Reichenbachiella sp. TaxID=2184521 RepID=UPI0032640EFC